MVVLMKLSRRKHLAALAIAGMILITIVQWVAFERAEERAEALPCNLTPAPYRLEVESLLPPGELLSRAIGHRYDGERLEVIVPGGLGKPDPLYTSVIEMADSRLNDSVGDLREFLGENDAELVKSAFQVVVRYYTLREVIRDHNPNLTAISFSPSPPLKWVLRLETILSGALQDPTLKTSLLAMVLGSLLTMLFFAWLYLIARLGGGVRGVLLSSLLILMLLLSLTEGLSHLAGKADGSGKGLEPATERCNLENSPYWDSLRGEALKMMWNNWSGTSCGALDYLRTVLTRDELETLVRIVSPNCSGLGF
jgi:hypothetical protein